MLANELNKGYQYTFDNGKLDISFYKEHGIYFIVGFYQYDNGSIASIHNTFETFKAGKKEFNSLKKYDFEAIYKN